ncbi:MAG: GTP-binding protein [Planctomycetota bacterium]
MTSPHSIGPVGDRVSFTLLTGFLGSGKTTVLREVLRLPDMAGTAVVVNEFGEVGLDHLLLEATEEDVVLLQSGCLCCSMRADLVDALERLEHRRAKGELPPFDRVVIETTGLADPAPVLQTIVQDPELGRSYALDGVLTVVDGFNGLATLERHHESRKQVAVADRILLTKLDLCDEVGDGAARRAALEAALDQLNPSAPRIRVDHGKVDRGLLFDVALFGRHDERPDVDGWLRDEALGRDAPADAGHPHDAGIESFCVTYDAPIPFRVFQAWYEALLEFKGPQLLRVKGILDVQESPVPIVIHSVQHAVHPPVALDAWPSGDRRSRIVFITQGIDEAQVDAAFEAALARLARAEAR